MALILPRIEVQPPEVDECRTVAIHLLREAADWIEVGDMQKARTLTDAAAVWLENL